MLEFLTLVEKVLIQEMIMQASILSPTMKELLAYKNGMQQTEIRVFNLCQVLLATVVQETISIALSRKWQILFSKMIWLSLVRVSLTTSSCLDIFKECCMMTSAWCTSLVVPTASARSAKRDKDSLDATSATRLTLTPRPESLTLLLPSFPI